jgi:hypothetical protein
MAQVEEHLTNKCEALSLDPTKTNKQTKKMKMKMKMPEQEYNRITQKKF